MEHGPSTGTAMRMTMARGHHAPPSQRRHGLLLQHANSSINGMNEEEEEPILKPVLRATESPPASLNLPESG